MEGTEEKVSLRIEEPSYSCYEIGEVAIDAYRTAVKDIGFLLILALAVLIYMLIWGDML